MNHYCMCWLILTSFLYLSFTVYTVSGKCSGRWAIHACYGGNGKRSGFADPSLNTENRKQPLLKRLLLREEPDEYKLGDWEQSLGQNFERENQDLSQPDIRQLTDLVRDLLLQKKLRTEMEADRLA